MEKKRKEKEEKGNDEWMEKGREGRKQQIKRIIYKKETARQQV